MGHKLVSKIKQASKPVLNTSSEVAHVESKKKTTGKRRMQMHKPMPDIRSEVVEVKRDPIGARRVAGIRTPKKFIQMDVAGSNGKVYTIVIPKCYRKNMPVVWSWNQRRYKVAEMISAGYPVQAIAKEVGVNRSLIYGWLQHPEFKEHVDGLTMETGWANKRERIAGLNKITRLLFDKVVDEIDGVTLSDKSIGPVLVAIQTIAKQIAQEKDEFVEQSKVENNTNVSGTLGVAVANIDTIMGSKSAEERRALEGEFRNIGDDIIRGITGEKE